MYSDGPTIVCSDKTAWRVAKWIIFLSLAVASLLFLVGCGTDIPHGCGVVKRMQFVADCFGTEKGCTQVVVDTGDGHYVDGVSYGIVELGDRMCVTGMDQIATRE